MVSNEGRLVASKGEVGDCFYGVPGEAHGVKRVGGSSEQVTGERSSVENIGERWGGLNACVWSGALQGLFHLIKYIKNHLGG